MTTQNLALFLDKLRGRLERGELAGHPPISIDLARTFTNVEQAVRIMLEDVDRYRAMTPALRSEAWNAAQRKRLANNLRQLQERLR